MKLSALCVVVLLLAFSSEAALILTENFSYPNGPITNAPGSQWSTHSGGGAGNEALVSSGKLEVSSARSEDINAPLLGAPYSTNSATYLYASFTVNFSALPTSSGSYFAHFNSPTFRAVVWAKTSGASAGAFHLGIGNTTTSLSVQLTNNLVTNQNYFVVTRYGLSNGLSTIWINPVAENDFNVTSFDSPNPTSIINFCFRQTMGIGTMLVDDLRVGTSFADVTSSNSIFAPTILTQPQSQSVTEGGNASFTVGADGTPPLFYQWRFNGGNLTNGTSAVLSLTNVVSANAGNYSVVASNTSGSITSDVVTLTVNSQAALTALSILTYNAKGNDATDWSTNAPQVQAIGRQMQYLQPDIITFQEIPNNLSAQMTNFVKAYLPGYSVARNSGTDGFIRSVIVSRFPIARSGSWLDGVSLHQWGYTNTNSAAADNFTRDLFEAQINVPGFTKPLHVFTTHLKSSSGGYTDAAAKRAAEAAAITNFFATNFFLLYPDNPYFLSGDFNEANTNTVAIQRLVSAPAGLRLTNPTNPFTGSINTFSIQASLSSRLDYILPCNLLFSNILSSQVFRTDLLNPVPSGIQTNDSRTASDHLPVLMTFKNPYDTPFRITSMVTSSQLLTLNWQSASGRQYRVESSTTLTNWTPLSAIITATGTNSNFTTNKTGAANFLRVYRFP